MRVKQVSQRVTGHLYLPCVVLGMLRIDHGMTKIDLASLRTSVLVDVTELVRPRAIFRASTLR